MSRNIYFVCPNSERAFGGIKQIFRQVESLNRLGIKAFVLLSKRKRPDWFQTDAPIAYSPYILKRLDYAVSERKLHFIRKLKILIAKRKSVTISSDDILVFPEVYGAESLEVLPECSMVLFNQNCYYTYGTYDRMRHPREIDYTHPRILGTIVVSENSKEYLSYAFPSAEVYRMRLGIQDTIFHFGTKKKRQLCYMTRKLREDSTQIVSILKQRPSLEGWEFIAINDKTEEEVAQIMKESVFFLSFNHREGFGLPPAEAMACGCYVIGYHGEGGREYLKPEFSSVIETGDIIHYVQKVEELVRTYDADPQALLTRGKMASDFILDRYSMQRQVEDTAHIWRDILSKL